MKKEKFQLIISIITLVFSVAIVALLVFNMTYTKNKTSKTDTYVVVKDAKSDDDTPSVLASGWNLTTKQASEKDQTGEFPVEVVDSKGKVVAVADGGDKVTLEVGSPKKDSK